MSHHELIQALKLYPAILKDFVAAIPPEKLHHRPGPGFWTVYEHHRDVAVSPAGSQPASAEDLVADYGRWRERQLQVIEKASDQLWRRSAQHPEYERYGFEILVRHVLLHDGFHLSRMEDLAFIKQELLQPL